MAKLLRLDVAQLTDVGRRRDHNEDNMAYVIPKDEAVMTHKGALLIVADGMGGHAAGEVASEIAVDTVSSAYYQDENGDVSSSLLRAIRRANAAIQQRAAENMLRSGMGTTCVAAVLRGNTAYIANIGDSRAYLVRQANIRQLSQDHSWVAEQVRAGLLTEEQARTHAQRNVITRSLGTQLDVDIDIFRETLEEGDRLLLCSDGLSGMVNDEELLRTINQFVPQESVYHLIERANDNGGTDNITAIVAQIQDLGIEPPNMRQPVLAGGPELSDEDTARLFVSQPNGASATARNGELPLPGSPFPTYSSGPLVSPESDTAPQPALRVKKQHGRLFYPTLVLLILFVLVAASGASYFLYRNKTVSSILNNADQLITQASSESSSHPTQALHDLATAQQQLRTLQNLDSSDNTRLLSLQTRLVTATKTAITSYNQAANIALLPCTNLTPSTLTRGAGVPPAQAATVLQINGPDLYYTLGQDGKIYERASANNLQPAFTLPTSNAQITNMAGTGGEIFALSTQTDANGLASYSLNLLRPDATAMLQPAPSQAIDTSLIQGGNIPSLITAWDNNAYVVLTSKSNPNSATILSYTLDNKGNLVTPQKTRISVSDGIVSAAAFPNQFFLLLADGSVLSLPVNPSDATFASSTPVPVMISGPIAPTLATGAQNFTASTSVPTVPSITQKGSGQLTIPLTSPNNPATLSAGNVHADSTAHLFIADPANHRVLDLVVKPAASSGGPDVTPTAATTSTNNAAGNSVTLNLVQQYASPDYFGTIKSVATNPGGTIVYILGQNARDTQSIIEVSAGPQQACAS